jgi:hypothetical protein
MWKALAIIFLGVASAATSLHSTTTAKVEYKTRRGFLAAIITADKAKQEAGQESTVEFYSPQNLRLCSMDLSSVDGEHGFGVVKSEWTPDEDYFVFSLASSGGHQSWHAPTLFYDLRKNVIRSLDSYVAAAGISKSDFALEFPNIVVTEAWRDESVPVKLRLDSLRDTTPKSKPGLQCVDGEVFRVDPYDLKAHE